VATGRIGTTPVLTTRWSKAPAAGTTSLSGLDDNSVSLVYSVGYEQVYLNGALLSRTNDYTATNGTSITMTNATVAGDIVEVFANAVVPLTDTYTQSVANGKFINNTLTTTTGDIIYASAANTPARLGIGSSSQVLTVSGGVPTWATPSSGGMTSLASGNIGSVSSVTLSSISQSYNDLILIIRGPDLNETGSADYWGLRATLDGVTTGYTAVWHNYSEGSSVTQSYLNNNSYIQCNYFGFRSDNTDNFVMLHIYDYASTSNSKHWRVISHGQDSASAWFKFVSEGVMRSSTGAIDSIKFEAINGLGSAANFTGGSYILYGVK
jgi:hypothetical protein